MPVAWLLQPVSITPPSPTGLTNQTLNVQSYPFFSLTLIILTSK